MGRRFPAVRPGLCALLLGALLLRMLVPAGFMLAADARGAPALVLCDGVAPPAATMPAMHGGHHHAPADPAQRHEAPCPYAALAAPVLPPLPPVVAAPVAPAGPSAPVVRPTAWSTAGPAAAPPPSTGPPLVA